MHRLKGFFRNFFDVRPGEYLRTLYMALYLMFVLFAYYILKPVSRSLFLNKFEIDEVPILHILIAGAGGILAYLYSKLADKTSLKNAVTWSMGLAVVCLVVMWKLLGIRDADGHAQLWWMLYVLNVWTSLFSIVLVSQGWLVAANVFNGREAKRLYGLLGLGAVVGAAFGGEFTRRTVELIGTTNLLLASGALVMLAYAAFRLVLLQPGVEVNRVRASGDEDTDFSFGYIVRSIRRTRHLQVIIAIISITFMVDVIVEYQFLAMAKERYSGNDLTAFFGSFYGLYLNLVTFFCQFLLTAAVISRFGVGGTLQIMPTAITLASLVTFFSPGVISTAAVRLTEAVNRYTLNRTGMELLYLPLPADLRNRTKAFVDIFADRCSRGIGGIILILLTNVLHLEVRQLALVVMGFAAVWIFLSIIASREYVATVRKRIESRRFDVEEARVRVSDPHTVRILEETAAAENPRQAAYALRLLAATQGYGLAPLLETLVSSPLPEVRRHVFELALTERVPGLLEAARAELNAHGEEEEYPTLTPAAAYAVAISEDCAAEAHVLLDHPNQQIAVGALQSICTDPVRARQVVTEQWLAKAAESEDWKWRVRAAIAIGRLPGEQEIERLHRLFEDPDPRVIEAAIVAAGRMKSRAHLHALVRRLGDAPHRGSAIEALAAFGPIITGTLGDILEDTTLPASLRRQVPRVLKRIAHQRSVDTLLHALSQPDLAIRESVLKALNRLREVSPQLKYDERFITEQIMSELRFYVQLTAALEPFRNGSDGHRATNLLRRTIEERLKQTLDRVFRLLGLKYPPKEIYSAYLAVRRREADQMTAAIEFLDHVLERELKRILLPLLDAPDHILERRDLFDVESKDIESALRELIVSPDPWLSACAMAAAAELRIRRLAPEIAEAGKRAEPEIFLVAQSAGEALAGA